MLARRIWEEQNFSGDSGAAILLLLPGMAFWIDNSDLLEELNFVWRIRMDGA